MIFDEDAARADDRKELESDVENAVVTWAENNGWIPRLMQYRGRRGCPDHFFFGYGAVVIIEFKRAKGGKLSDNQIRERERLAAVGVTVHVCNDVEHGKAILREFMK